jgi:hypothetical protein
MPDGYLVPGLLQYSGRKILAGGEASGAGGRTCSVPHEEARAACLFCFVLKPKRSSVRNASVTVLSGANDK